MMRERFRKASRWLSVMAGLLVIAVCSNAFAAGAGSIEFGIAAVRSKVDYGTYLYSPGQHSIVVKGSEVYVAYPSRNAAGDYEVCIGKSLDGGVSWERPEIVASSPNI